jgi:murein DD-endopeptidase MepM/ murein hydrolase activator NlpD
MRLLPALASVLLSVSLAVLSTPDPVSAADVPQPSRDGVWPLQPRPDIVRGFEPPASLFGAGHRGVDLLGRAGQAVHTSLGGTVTFASPLAGRGVVVVDHGGLRTTYEPVSATVTVGDVVGRGAVIGDLRRAGSHCFPRACLHWGLRRGAAYLDPLVLVGAGPVRLLPLEGSGARVGELVGRAQSFVGDVGVDLRGGQGGVAEQLLHRAQVGASLEQVGRRGVS